MSDIAHKDLINALGVRYGPPYWVLLKEVKDATGYGWSRSADAVYDAAACDS